jgi:hypothetical protein
MTIRGPEAQAVTHQDSILDRSTISSGELESHILKTGGINHEKCVCGAAPGPVRVTLRSADPDLGSSPEIETIAPKIENHHLGRSGCRDVASASIDPQVRPKG